MANITIPKKEYQKLLDGALRFEYLRRMLQEDIFSPPPVRNVKEIIKEFRTTKLYNEKFLKSLEKGLTRSSCFK